MGINWKDSAKCRNKNFTKEVESYGRVRKFINLKMSDEGIIFDARNQVEYTITQAKELIDRGWAETKCNRLLEVLSRES